MARSNVAGSLPRLEFFQPMLPGFEKKLVISSMFFNRHTNSRVDFAVFSFEILQKLLNFLRHSCALWLCKAIFLWVNL